ncbi:hypothetical protein [Tolypothrix bouteillei]|uniref:Uncharacterized protein n=1 Tax=Tolypothrix bouteillei VB521301 TaxID=1479485 RepID=A0A0C1RIP3_9CYAN|nr:hypothetical protein [Tolypothrix bouteillei]
MRPTKIQLVLTIIGLTLFGSNFIPAMQLKVKYRTISISGQGVVSQPVKSTVTIKEPGFNLSSNSLKKQSENNQVFFWDLNRTHAQVWRGSHLLEFHNVENLVD